MRALVLAGLVACSSAGTSAKVPPAPDPGAALLAAIDRGDLEGARAALCAAYAARGAECAEPLRLDQLAPDDVMSRYSAEDDRVTMQPMPPAGGGLAYWDNWSALLSGGAWRARDLFADDAEARRVANMLLATVLAHELGHHLANVYGCHASGSANELLADQLSVPLIRELATGELGALHARMRAVADAMIDAVPAELRVVPPAGADVATWAAGLAQLPADRRAYVTLHLARQRALLAEGASFAASAGPACLEPFAASLASRRLVETRVRTERRVPAVFGDLVALDAEGRMYSTSTIADEGVIVINSLDGGAPIRVPVYGFAAVDAFAAQSPTRFAVITSDVMEIDASTTPPTMRVAAHDHPMALAFDREGALVGVDREYATSTWTAYGLPAGDVRWTGPTRRSSAWLDGPLATAELSPDRVAIAGRALVAADGRSLRLVEDGVVTTLAGGVRGSRDGDSARAKLTGIVAVRALADGSIRFVEDHGDEWVVRVLERGP